MQQTTNINSWIDRWNRKNIEIQYKYMIIMQFDQ